MPISKLTKKLRPTNSTAYTSSTIYHVCYLPYRFSASHQLDSLLIMAFRRNLDDLGLNLGLEILIKFKECSFWYYFSWVFVTFFIYDVIGVKVYVFYYYGLMNLKTNYDELYVLVRLFGLLLVLLCSCCAWFVYIARRSFIYICDVSLIHVSTCTHN